uniref:Associated molecule with the sh3 domain of stam 1 isoform protein n=1 Tax=Tetraselmis sp. GSL018 TaxID=582737 RepID=A0A061RST2_9CHLO|eukprot:CAMPEP_0177592536 /NCGR_PEP_ID=MMETSP0419_2-20121207/8614_1 /TAXON_ID=582737 /ORGANISM="Tetraselmis sp., Strain GSL018" /LENGTH=325 /DNA_ID=CAMNT_0019083413 /DNA_START=525 /DNA_END=1502 /DNA_ORIENTATION=+
MPQVGGPGRASKPPSRSQQLAAKAIKKRVRPVLGLRYYYRSAELLLQQADSYRRQKNEDELYVMLLRYASLVLETIPDHSDFRNGVDSKYQELKAKASPVIEELERLKLSLDTKGPNLHLLPKPPPAAKQDVQQVASTMLPEADWTLLRPPISALPLGNGRAKSASPVAPAPAPEKQPPSAPAELPPAPNDDPGFVLARPSAAALERHCLVGPIGGESGRGQHSPWQHQQEPPQPMERAPLYNIHLMESSPVSIQQVLAEAVSDKGTPLSFPSSQNRECLAGRRVRLVGCISLFRSPGMRHLRTASGGEKAPAPALGPYCLDGRD